MITFPNVVLTKKTRRSASFWAVFAPFSSGLWIAIALSVVYGALVLLLLNCAASGLPPRATLRAFPSLVYHTGAALLGGDEYDLYHALGFGRVYRVGLLFFVLVLGATYTANLAAFLLMPAELVHGPATMAELAKTKVCHRWPAFRAPSEIEYVGEFVDPPADLAFPEIPAWSRDALQRGGDSPGGCDAIVEISVNAYAEALEHCDTMHLHADLTSRVVVDYNMMRGDDVELWRNVSGAILRTLQRKSYQEIVSRNMRFDKTCAAPSIASAQISARQMGGSFILFGASGVAAVAATFASRYRRRRAGGGGDDADERPKEEVQNEKLDAKLDVVLRELRGLREEIDAPKPTEMSELPVAKFKEGGIHFGGPDVPLKI